MEPRLLRSAVITGALLASLYSLPAGAQEAGSGSGTPADSSPPTDAPVTPQTPPPTTPPAPETPPTAEPPAKVHTKKHKHDAAPAAIAADATAVTEEPKKKKQKKNKNLSFGGRVIARAAFQQQDPVDDWSGNQSIDSARLRADYATSDVHAQISVELVPKPRIKNAFVELRVVDGEPRVSIRAGRFKMPISAIELSSRWELPMTDRGLVHTILVNRYQIAGRAVGGMATLLHKPASHLRVDAGVFQGSDDAGNALEVTGGDRFGQDFVARASVRPARGIEIAAAAQARVGALNVDAPPIIRRGRVAELDATLQHDVGSGVLRAWVEGMIGTSWIAGRMVPCSGYMPCKALFLEGRAIAAYRVGGHDRKQRYGEVYAIASAIDPDRDTADDRIVEAGAGISYGAWEQWRLQAGFDLWRFGDAAPLGIETFAAAPANTERVLVQLGARF